MVIEISDGTLENSDGLESGEDSEENNSERQVEMSSDADSQMIQVDFLQEEREENNPEWAEMSSDAQMPDSQMIQVDFLALVVVGF
jgi:hypothetical protein